MINNIKILTTSESNNWFKRNLYQKNLKKNANVKITNLINKKSIIAKVGKKSDYPIFYNSVISIRISDTLKIDKNINKIISNIANIID